MARSLSMRSPTRFNGKTSGPARSKAEMVSGLLAAGSPDRKYRLMRQVEGLSGFWRGRTGGGIPASGATYGALQCGDLDRSSTGPTLAVDG